MKLLVCLSVLICADWMPLSYTKSLADKVDSTYTFVKRFGEFEVSILTSGVTGEKCFGENSCYPLLEQGSCEDTQWVVLDKSPSGHKLQPTCREKPSGAPKCPGAECAGSYYNFLGKAECCCPSYDAADSLTKFSPCVVHRPSRSSSSPYSSSSSSCSSSSCSSSSSFGSSGITEVKPRCATSNTARCAKNVVEEKKKPNAD